MAEREFVLFTGDGNQGEMPRDIIVMDENDCPYAFMDVIIANGFIPGHKARSHAYQNTVVDGEEEYSIHSTLYEGYRKETEMGAAYKTARIEPKPENDWYDDLHKHTIAEYLDRYAYSRYQKNKNK